MSERDIELRDLALASEQIRWLMAYWKRIRAGRTMPRRQDFDPIDIVSFLPGILLVDVEGVRPDGLGLYRYRVVGEWEVRSRGHNPTGKLVDEGFYGPSQYQAIGDYDTVRITAGPLYAPLEFVDERGLLVDELSILLPFSENGETVSQILVYSERRTREMDV